MMQPTRLDAVQRKSFEAMNCSVAQCLEVIGDWWTMLIVRDAFLGVRRFDDFQSPPRHLPQHPDAPADEPGRGRRPREGALPGHPPRNEYVLTDKGRDLWPVLTAMREWGDRWAAPDGAPLEVVHDACGEVMAWPHVQRLRRARRPALGARPARARRAPGRHRGTVGAGRAVAGSAGSRR